MNISVDTRVSIYQAYIAGVKPSEVAKRLRLNLKTVIRLYLQFDGV